MFWREKQPQLWRRGCWKSLAEIGSLFCCCLPRFKGGTVSYSAFFLLRIRFWEWEIFALSFHLILPHLFLNFIFVFLICLAFFLPPLSSFDHFFHLSSRRSYAKFTFLTLAIVSCFCLFFFQDYLFIFLSYLFIYLFIYLFWFLNLIIFTNSSFIQLLLIYFLHFILISPHQHFLLFLAFLPIPTHQSFIYLLFFALIFHSF